jgi:peptidoglycan/LPS O-acetylase OafA/YrhL
VHQSEPEEAVAHILQLDGIRGLAIALVVSYHFLAANDQTTSKLISVFIGLRSSLWIGVDIFFALSGFLITGILFNTVSSPNFLSSFYGRRCVRIFPLYFLALAVIGVIVFIQGKHWNGYQLPYIFYLTNTPLVLGHRVPEPLFQYSNHLWSLALEEQFYLFWPLLVLVLKDRRKLMFLAIALSLAAILIRVSLSLRGYDPEYTYKMLPCRMDSLLLGGWLALAIRGAECAAVVRRCKAVFFMAILILLVDGCVEHGLDWGHSRFINTIGYTVIAIASTSLIAIALSPDSKVGKFFRLSWLRGLGKYSYGIYVWHMLIGPPVNMIARTKMNVGTSSKLAHILLGWLLATIVSVVVGLISYHAFEIHFLRLKRLFPYQRVNRKLSHSTTETVS